MPALLEGCSAKLGFPIRQELGYSENLPTGSYDKTTVVMSFSCRCISFESSLSVTR